MSVVAVVGLGYVGLPLAIEFGKKCRTVGQNMKRGCIVVYESTVYPGATDLSPEGREEIRDVNECHPFT